MSAQKKSFRKAQSNCLRVFLRIPEQAFRLGDGGTQTLHYTQANRKKYSAQLQATRGARSRKVLRPRDVQQLQSRDHSLENLGARFCMPACTLSSRSALCSIDMFHVAINLRPSSTEWSRL